MWRTWANLLTLLRLLVAIPCGVAAWQGSWTLAAALLTVAIVTDLLDGPVARRFNHQTPLGGLLDHTTDAVFISLVLAGLAARGLVSLWLPALVMAAFIQYTLDSKALRGQQLRSSWLGRSNGVAYFVLGSIPIYTRALQIAWPTDAVIFALSWVLVTTTVISMADRLWAWRASRP